MDDLKLCYEILGLRPGASEEELRQAYRDLIKVWHPDRFCHDPRLQHKAQEKLKEINDAYEKIRLAQSTQGQTFYEKTQYETSEKETPPSSPPPPTNDKSGSDDAEVIEKPQPWVRYWARLLDMQIFLSISLIPISFLSIPIIGFISTNFLLMLLFIFLFSVFLEASVIAIFGNTPAKALFRTKIIDRKGKGLPFTEALKRSFYVAIVGNAFYLPLVCLVPWLWQYKKLTREGKTSWDNRFGFNVVHSRIGGLRITSYLILFVLLNTFTDKLLPQIIASNPSHYSDDELKRITGIKNNEFGKRFVPVDYDPFAPDRGRSKDNEFGKGNGKISVFTEHDTGTTNVYVDGIFIGQLNSYFPVGTDPACGQDGTVSKILEAGSHQFHAQNSDGTYWDATINIAEGECRRQRLQKTTQAKTAQEFNPLPKTEYKKKNGKLSIYTEYKHGTTDVYVDGVFMGRLNNHFPAGSPAPECEEEGTINKTLTPGSHQLNAKNSDGTSWEFTVNIKEGLCHTFRLSKQYVNSDLERRKASDIEAPSKPKDATKADSYTPDFVKGKWKDIKVEVLDKAKNQRSIITVHIGSDAAIPGSNLRIKAESFLPEFRMKGTNITSASNEPKNPGARIAVSEEGREIYNGWLFVLYPSTYPFEHPKYSLTLVGYTPAF